MKQLTRFTAVVAIASIFFAACKKDLKTNDNLAAKPATQTSLQQGSESTAAINEQFSKLSSALSANGQSLLLNSPYQAATDAEGYLSILKRLAGIESTPCDPHTLLFNWMDQQVSDWNQQLFDYAYGIRMINLPGDYAYFFENSSVNQYFGIKGEYTQVLTKIFKDQKRFWNIESSGMVMVAMHGSILRDREKLIKTYMTAYGLNLNDAQYYADLVLYLISNVPQYRNGDHPNFTFNAFAHWANGNLPFKIVMGDGILQAYTAIGFNDVAPQAILSHEFGHQVQFQLGIYSNGTAESTRKIEMMADAFAAYFLSHSRGAAMQWKRVKQFLQVFFSQGDCAIDNPAHHGTPTQRMAAAEWAYNLANAANQQGQILTAQAFVARFEAQLPELLTH